MSSDTSGDLRPRRFGLVVARHVSECTPVKVCYELTPKGRALAPALAELKAWADRWLD